ncbi:MAG: glycosyltransferase family 2 protein [Lachnospiraceae bacterium]|nr:glycosyltransferase family 2 protein [Lachnospiraceae bacterium]
MGSPRIQIIIPVYNAENYLKRCLDSIQMQTFTDWQAIIVDDASFDGSTDIIKDYCSADERFVYIRLEVNSGAAAARNVALSRLSSEYTAFLDADDYWEHDMLAHLMEKAEKNASDIVQCRFIYDFPGGKQLLPKGAFSKDVSLCDESLRQVYLRMMTGINMNHVCMKLMRTQLLKGMQFDTRLKTAEDLNFCIRLFQRVRKYDFINEALYHYCRNETSLTGNGLSAMEKFKANKHISDDLIDALPALGMDNIFYRGLSYMRPYTITVSKIWRMLCEKVILKR